MPSLDGVLDLINKYPIYIILSWILIRIILGCVNLAFKWAENRILPTTNTKIKSHSYFVNMDWFIRRRIDELIIEDEFKNKIGKQFLKFKFQSFRDWMSEFLDSNYKELDQDEFNTKILERFNCMILEYEQKARLDWIPELFIIKFNKFHLTTIEETAEFITNIAYSTWFSNNEQKMCAILHFLTGAFMRTLLDFQKTIISINGDLAGLEYKGLICKWHDHEE